MKPKAPARRESLFLGICLALIVPVGYWLRFRAPIPLGWRDHSGGAVYVLLWILLWAYLQPGSNRMKVSLVVLGVTCTLEFLQLWHPVWLEAIRATFPGRVLLGTTFDPSDFPSYFAGALLGWLTLTFARQLR